MVNKIRGQRYPKINRYSHKKVIIQSDSKKKTGSTPINVVDNNGGNNVDRINVKDINNVSIIDKNVSDKKGIDSDVNQIDLR